MGSGAIIYISPLIMIDLGIQKLIGVKTGKHRQGDRISLLLFFKTLNCNEVTLVAVGPIIVELYIFLYICKLINSWRRKFRLIILEKLR
jgi:hypothetical protein